jgi:hypothetical protein
MERTRLRKVELGYEDRVVGIHTGKGKKKRTEGERQGRSGRTDRS